jgi:predicted acetyltransferase
VKPTEGERSPAPESEGALVVALRWPVRVVVLVVVVPVRLVWDALVVADSRAAGTRGRTGGAVRCPAPPGLAAAGKPLVPARDGRQNAVMPELVLPTVAVHESFVAAMKEFEAEGRAGDGTSVGSDIDEFGARWHEPEGFAAYVAAIRADEREETVRHAGHVPCTTLWYVEGDTYLARFAIRHRLNDFLLEQGGHVGYDVRASARRRGHATAMLREGLPHLRRLGIDPALITCEHDNTASRKVIEGGGGVLEDRRGDKLRYWVPTA